MTVQGGLCVFDIKIYNKKQPIDQQKEWVCEFAFYKMTGKENKEKRKKKLKTSHSNL